MIFWTLSKKKVSFPTPPMNIKNVSFIRAIQFLPNGIIGVGGGGDVVGVVCRFVVGVVDITGEVVVTGRMGGIPFSFHVLPLNVITFEYLIYWFI